MNLTHRTIHLDRWCVGLMRIAEFSVNGLLFIRVNDHTVSCGRVKRL